MRRYHRKEHLASLRFHTVKYWPCIDVTFNLLQSAGDFKDMQQKRIKA